MCGEDVPNKAAPLVIISGAHRLDDAGGVLRVVPEQPIGCEVVLTVEDEQIEVRPTPYGFTIWPSSIQ